MSTPTPMTASPHPHPAVTRLSIAPRVRSAGREDAPSAWFLHHSQQCVQGADRHRERPYQRLRVGPRRCGEQADSGEPPSTTAMKPATSDEVDTTQEPSRRHHVADAPHDQGHEDRPQDPCECHRRCREPTVERLRGRCDRQPQDAAGNGPKYMYS